ncbi:hypothetical protein [Micromonospora sp. NPDC006431]|uniref:DUF7144 family membrane protein n=1 Tax=Micromonospora sp. NPDC006431 TaxID=3364235 RepID=UPI00368038BF
MDSTGAGRAGSGRPLLAGSLLAGAGLVDVLTSWAHTAGDQFVAGTAQGMHAVDIVAWAWLHVAIGVAVALAGLLVLTGRRGTVLFAVCCALPAVVVDVLLFPYAPIRALLVVALDGAALRLLFRHARAGARPGAVSAARRPGRSAPDPLPGSPTTGD